jgi:predicted dehydrogenase
MTPDDGLTRRDFLKKSAVAAAALTVGVNAVARAEEAAEPLHCGIIGTGSQGRQLMQQVLRLPDVKIAAVCDIYPPNLELGLQLATEAKAYKDYRRLLARDDLRAVIVATPLDRHAYMSIDGLRAGKWVFCEKAMARTIEQAKAMARAVRETGCHLQIGHQRRYSPMYQHAYQMIKDGVLGTITHVRAQWNRNGSWRRAVADEKYERLLNWRLYWEHSGGLMTELGSHQMDVVNWFLGARPLAVTGIAGLDYWKDGREVWDNVQCIFEYPGSDKVERIKVTYQSICTNAFDDCSEQFMGDKGTLIMTSNGAEDSGRLVREASSEELEWSQFAHKEKLGGKDAIVLDAQATVRKSASQKEGEALTAQEHANDYFLELQQFFKDVRAGTKPACDVQVGLESDVTVLVANEAMRTGRRIEYTPDMFRA